jgi:ACT domain-containing protein
MAIKKAAGRPPQVSIKTINKLADLISHNYTISDSCRYTRLSRSTYYYYLNNEPLFAEIMAQAHKNKNKVSFNFRTTF